MVNLVKEVFMSVTMSASPANQPKSYKIEIVWRKVIILVLYHLVALQGLYYILSLTAKWKTPIFGFLLIYILGQGHSSGVHRLWAHKSYKAELPLQILLCFLQTACFQNSIYAWSRDHRVHHKFADTDADPHNSTRGFFFSHMGWLMVRKHPDVITKGKTVDMSDLEADPVVRFQYKYYSLLAPIACFVLPTLIPWYFWQEDIYVSFCIVGMLRFLLSLHFACLVNSAAHLWGYKPYDRNIKPSENRLVSILTAGEAWHNYHHVFPWDYKARELDVYSGSWSTAFIDFMAKISWAYDLRTPTQEMIRQRIERTGGK